IFFRLLALSTLRSTLFPYTTLFRSKKDKVKRGTEMKRFNIIFKQYMQYYIYCIIVLVIVFIFTYSAFILGLIIGMIGSLINTFTFEYYLEEAKEKDNIHISTGNICRYLVVILACTTWYFYKDHINIFGVVVGLMISYVLIVFKPFLHKK